MPKRDRDCDEEEAESNEGRLLRAPKRTRLSRPDRFSVLSDELLLRTLSYLRVSDLNVCARLSYRLKVLATDSQLWKALYYDRFVRPRASRIPGLRDPEAAPHLLHYASKISRWLDDHHLIRDGTTTDWKRQYKLRHNWSRGNAQVTETEVAEQPSSPPLLIRLHEGVVIIADSQHGLRAWTLKGEDRHIASTSLHADSTQWGREPMSLAVDMAKNIEKEHRIAVGFDDGSFSVYSLSPRKKSFTHVYSHVASSNGTISALAYCSPYLLTMSQQPQLSLYIFDDTPGALNDTCISKAPRLLSSLRSATAHLPIALSLRIANSTITASIAYAMPCWITQWSVGLQELRLTLDGTTLDSRIASAKSGVGSQPPDWLDFARRPNDASALHTTHSIPVPASRPTSLSYHHPYLLTAHPDNTLTLYMVTSSADTVEISEGNRLWGHTSSVSGAHVGERGKAVSVSTMGNELRVWELEGGTAQKTSRKRISPQHSSVQVHVEAVEKTKRSEEVAKGWISFDDEKVVLLREKTYGAQALVVYDFS